MRFTFKKKIGSIEEKNLNSKHFDCLITFNEKKNKIIYTCIIFKINNIYI